MKQENDSFRPIRLVDPKVIKRRGYYTCQVMSCDYKDQELNVAFEVTKGDKKGFRMRTNIKMSYRGIARLTYLCEAAGISRELTDPKELIGKKVKVRVVPRNFTRQGRTYLVHRITRFHHVSRKF